MSAAAYRLPDNRENVDDSSETTDRLSSASAGTLIEFRPADYTIPIAQFAVARDHSDQDDFRRCIILSNGARQLTVDTAGEMLLDGEPPKDDRSVVEFLREYGTVMAKFSTPVR